MQSLSKEKQIENCKQYNYTQITTSNITNGNKIYFLQQLIKNIYFFLNILQIMGLQWFLDARCRTNIKQNRLGQLQNLYQFQVGYDPFVYSLQNQIITRKYNKKLFTSKQVAKVFRSILSTFRLWFHTYPNIKIGQASPQNILFDHNGHIKLASIFSFPPQAHLEYNGNLLPYSQVNTINSIYNNYPKTQKQIIVNQCMRQLAYTLLKMICLHLENEPVYSPQTWRQQISKYKHIQFQICQLIINILQNRVVINNQQQLDYLSQTLSKISSRLQ